VEAYSNPLGSPAVLKGPTSKERERKGRGRGGKVNRREGGGGRDLTYPKILA